MAKRASVGIVVLLAAISALAAPVARAQCGWADGQDPAAPRDDPGRGVSDWTQHYAFASDGGGAARVAQVIASRLAALRACMPPDRFARLYADVSVRIAYVGRTGAGWIDGADPSAPPGDPGRGVALWQAHYDYAASAAGAAGVAGFVAQRLRELAARVAPAAHARLYADLSILLATYSRTR